MAARVKSGRWPDHFRSRVSALRRRLRSEKLDALLVNCPADTRYLTGFSGEDSWTLVTPTTLTVLSDRRFEEELAGIGFVRSVMRRTSLSQELGKLVRKQRIRRLGVQSEHITLATRKALVSDIGAQRLKLTSRWLVEQRSVKDATELPLLRRAIQIQERALERTLPKLRPGMTEKQLCALLEYNIKQLGGDGPSFHTIVAAGANSSIPHYRPGDDRIRAGSPVLIDFGAIYCGYHSDMTRVVAIRSMPRKIVEIYKIVREAQLAGIAAIRPGASLKDVDAAARKVIKKAGYGKQFGHGLGHGIGLEIHEEPRLSWLAEGELKPGQIVTVEPGIYLPGLGGVRLEDDVLVTQRGYRNLCTLPTDLESAII